MQDKDGRAVQKVVEACGMGVGFGGTTVLGLCLCPPLKHRSLMGLTNHSFSPQEVALTFISSLRLLLVPCLQEPSVHKCLSPPATVPRCCLFLGLHQGHMEAWKSFVDRLRLWARKVGCVVRAALRLCGGPKLKKLLDQEPTQHKSMG